MERRSREGVRVATKPFSVAGGTVPDLVEAQTRQMKARL